jgi:hypothetical protein
MHYKDGTPAKVGDLVRGIGYNIKHEIQGIVVGCVASDTCNIQVAHVQNDGPYDGTLVFSGPTPDPAGPNENGIPRTVPTLTYLRVAREYGEAKNFEKIA